MKKKEFIGVSDRYVNMAEAIRIANSNYARVEDALAVDVSRDSLTTPSEEIMKVYVVLIEFGTVIVDIFSDIKIAKRFVEDSRHQVCPPKSIDCYSIQEFEVK